MKYELNVNATCDEYLDGDIFPYISQTQNNSDCLLFSLLRWLILVESIIDVVIINVVIIEELIDVDLIEDVVVYQFKVMFKH